MKMTDLTALLIEKRETAGAGAPLRVVICGEVSAGKSTVMNALMRAHLLPDNIGRQERPLLVAGWREIPGIETINRDGREMRAALPGEAALFHEADFARLWLDQPHLAGIELIELPMTKAEDLTDEQIDLVASADVFIWVTIGSQAWRLTEKAIVEALGETRPERSILIVSRGDKLRNDNDRGRLMERMERETSSMFAHRLFLFGERRRIAASAESDADWEETGGAALAAILRGFAGQEPAAKAGPARKRAKPAEVPVIEPVAEDEPDMPVAGAETAEADQSAEAAAAPVVEEPIVLDAPEADKAEAEEPEAEAPVETVVLEEPPESVQEDPAPAGVATEDAAEAAPEEAPAETTPEAPVPQPEAEARPAPRGLLLAGIARETGAEDYTPLAGPADEVAMLGALCRQMADGLATTNLLSEETGPLNGFSLSTHQRRLMFQVVPGTGLVFILVDGAALNQGLAQVMLNQIAADPQKFD